MLNSGSRTLLKVLPVLGALPFVLGSALVALNTTSLPWIGQVQALILSYALAIVSFMAGVHWGQYLSGNTTDNRILIVSNGVTVTAWLSYNLLAPAHFAIMLIILFIVLLAVDRRLATNGSIEHDYLRTRASVTTLVIISLAIIAHFAV